MIWHTILERPAHLRIQVELQSNEVQACVNLLPRILLSASYPSCQKLAFEGWHGISFIFVSFTFLARFLFSKWSVPLRRARFALLGLYHPALLFLLCLSHSTLQPRNLTGDRNNPSLIDVTSHHSFMVLRLGTGESSCSSI